MKWVVFATNSDLKCQAFGPFKTEAAAERWAHKMEKRRPAISWLALPVTPRAEAEV